MQILALFVFSDSKDLICSNDRTFWVTTGLFPQQFIVQLQNESDFSKIKTVTTNVRGIKFDKCSEQTPSSFETFHESEIPKPQGGKIQSQTHTVRVPFPIARCVSGKTHLILSGLAALKSLWSRDLDAFAWTWCCHEPTCFTGIMPTCPQLECPFRNVLPDFSCGLAGCLSEG